MATLRLALQALIALANAYTAKLRNDAPLALWRARLEIARDIEGIADEIERLRDAGGDANARRADELRQRLLARQGLADALPAARFAPPGGSAGGDA